ncbi:hypothetical protein DWUX_141 [Desulfovibrio diazotrophicus]|nr:hypothetical protein DWUX_141 [Desulfovibrio diazotrophicus]
MTALQRLQKIAHIGGAAPLNHIKDPTPGQIDPPPEKYAIEKFVFLT